MKGTSIRYSADEMAWLKANRSMVISAYHLAFVARFGRDDVSAPNLHALRKRRGWKTGRDGRFLPGQVSHNKGKTCAPGTGGRHPNAQRTQFKSGGLPHNTKGAGHERIDTKNGYAILIVDERNPWTGGVTRPVFKHRWLWEQKHVPIPKGMALKCLDGDKLNTDPSNWELIPRAMLPGLSGRFGRNFDQAPAELKPTIMAVARLEHQVREKRKGRG